MQHLVVPTAAVSYRRHLLRPHQTLHLATKEPIFLAQRLRLNVWRTKGRLWVGLFQTSSHNSRRNPALESATTPGKPTTLYAGLQGSRPPTRRRSLRGSGLHGMLSNLQRTKEVDAALFDPYSDFCLCCTSWYYLTRLLHARMEYHAQSQ